MALLLKSQPLETLHLGNESFSPCKSYFSQTLDHIPRLCSPYWSGGGPCESCSAFSASIHVYFSKTESIICIFQLTNPYPRDPRPPKSYPHSTNSLQAVSEPPKPSSLLNLPSTPAPTARSCPTHPSRNPFEPLHVQPIFSNSFLLLFSEVIDVNSYFRTFKPFVRVDEVVAESTEPDGRIDYYCVIHC